MKTERDNILKNSEINETEYEKTLSFEALRQDCLIFVQNNFQGKEFKNNTLGINIRVSRQGIGEWKMKSKSREQILSIKILDKMLINADFTHDANDEKPGRYLLSSLS